MGQGCPRHAWDTLEHHGSTTGVRPGRRLSWGDGHETSSSTWDPRINRPIGRSHTFSWNNSETNDRGSGSNGSVVAWRVHGKSIANKSTCPALLDEVDYTRLSYTPELDLGHKTANRVGWDISHTSIPFEILVPPNAHHGKGIPYSPPNWEDHTRASMPGRLLHHVIQFFHHIFHRRSGIFHHFAHHRITVHGRHRLNGVLLFLLPRRRVA